jgi:hypothetical protein
VAQSGDKGAPSPVYSRVAAAVLTERFDEILEDYDGKMVGLLSVERERFPGDLLRKRWPAAARLRSVRGCGE